jgi:hypothetical protein
MISPGSRLRSTCDAAGLGTGEELGIVALYVLVASLAGTSGDSQQQIATVQAA